MQKRHATLGDIDAAIKRCSARLRRAVNMIQKLEAKRRRLLHPKTARPVTAKPEPAAVTPQATMPVPVTAPASPADDLVIPGWLARQGYIGNKTPADLAAIAEIEASKAERDKRKATASKAKSKAKARGDLRRMPLQGKAALAEILKVEDVQTAMKR